MGNNRCPVYWLTIRSNVEREKSNQNRILSSYMELFWGNIRTLYSLKPWATPSMRIWVRTITLFGLLISLIFCAGVYSNINHFTPYLIPLSIFTWYINKVLRRWWSILTVFNRHDFIQNYSKEPSPNMNNWRNQKGMMGKILIQGKWRRTSS